MMNLGSRERMDGQAMLRQWIREIGRGGASGWHPVSWVLSRDVFLRSHLRSL